jgi:hypothetical protein
MHFKILSGKTARDKPRVMVEKRGRFEGFEEVAVRRREARMAKEEGYGMIGWQEGRLSRMVDKD